MELEAQNVIKILQGHRIWFHFSPSIVLVLLCNKRIRRYPLTFLLQNYYDKLISTTAINTITIGFVLHTSTDPGLFLWTLTLTLLSYCINIIVTHSFIDIRWWGPATVREGNDFWSSEEKFFKRYYYYYYYYYYYCLIIILKYN